MNHQSPTNQDRAERAKVVLLAYIQEVSGDREDLSPTREDISDLLTDLHHYADLEKIPFYEAYALSDHAYREEFAESESTRLLMAAYQSICTL